MIDQPIEAPMERSIDHFIPDVLVSVHDMSMVTTETELIITNASERIHMTRQQLESLLEFSRHFLHRDWT